MYNENMIKRAKDSDAHISKGINKAVLGFTLIETMLFLALAGLMFAGLVAGTNGAIRQQRYKDSVQGFVDDLRDLYSLAENVEVIDYGDGTPYCGGSTASKGRGRSRCSVYGIYAIISPTKSNRNNIEAYWVTGIDQSVVDAPKTSDATFLSGAMVSTDTLVDGIHKNLSAKSHSLLWGADLVMPCATNRFADGCNGLEDGRSSNRNQVSLFIYRSPITGSINTLTHIENGGNVKDELYNEDIFAQGIAIYNSVSDGRLSHNDVSFCVLMGTGMSNNGGLRMVTIDGHGSNTNAVRLIEADSEDNKCNK